MEPPPPPSPSPLEVVPPPHTPAPYDTSHLPAPLCSKNNRTQHTHIDAIQHHCIACCFAVCKRRRNSAIPTTQRHWHPIGIGSPRHHTSQAGLVVRSGLVAAASRPFLFDPIASDSAALRCPCRRFLSLSAASHIINHHHHHHHHRR